MPIDDREANMLREFGFPLGPQALYVASFAYDVGLGTWDDLDSEPKTLRVLLR
jgi:hypothetical protein